MDKLTFENALTDLFSNSNERHWEILLDGSDLGDYLEIIQDGEWIDDGKYSYLEDCIIKNSETGDFYEINQGRSGSYFSEYYYDEPTFWQVEKKIVQTEVWIKI